MHEYLGLFVLSLKLKARMGQKELTLSGFALNSGRGLTLSGFALNSGRAPLSGCALNSQRADAFGLCPQLRTGQRGRPVRRGVNCREAPEMLSPGSRVVSRARRKYL